MLSRTADHMYWMARYIERAENVARVLDVTSHMSMVPNVDSDETALWENALQISGNEEIFYREFDSITAANVIYHLALDSTNPSSIYNALHSARENARSVRVAMTTETWENINAMWIEFAQFADKDLLEIGLSVFCEWVKGRSHLFRGVCFGTMLRDEAFCFLRLGTFIERADNTARLLLTKYDSLSPKQRKKGSVDYYEWSALLRQVAAFQAYQHIYRDSIDPLKVAELLVLRCDMPRSLHACYDEITTIIEQVTTQRQGDVVRIAGEMHARLHYGQVVSINKEGLSDFLGDFLATNNQLGSAIQRHFLSAVAT